MSLSWFTFFFSNLQAICVQEPGADPEFPLRIPVGWRSWGGTYSIFYCILRLLINYTPRHPPPPETKLFYERIYGCTVEMLRAPRQGKYRCSYRGGRVVRGGGLVFFINYYIWTMPRPSTPLPPALQKIHHFLCIISFQFMLSGRGSRGGQKGHVNQHHIQEYHGGRGGNPKGTLTYHLAKPHFFYKLFERNFSNEAPTSWQQVSRIKWRHDVISWRWIWPSWVLRNGHFFIKMKTT